MRTKSNEELKKIATTAGSRTDSNRIAAMGELKDRGLI